MSHVEFSVAALRERLGQRIPAVEAFRGQVAVVVEREAIREACEMLHTDPRLGYDLLATLTAVDHWPQEPRYSIIYQLYSTKHNAVSYTHLTLPTIYSV